MKRDVILWLDESAYSESGVIGMSHQICINSISGICYLPGGSCSVGDMLYPPFTSKELTDVNWGMVNSSNSVTIKALLLSFDLPDNSDRAWIADFSRAIDLWGYSLRDWLAVLADGPTDHLWMIATKWVDKELNRDVESFRYHEDHFHQPYHLSRWQWQRVLDYASAGTEPQIARNLMIKAERAAFIGRNREAVISAATAVELAITTGLKERLLELGTASELIEIIIAQTKMLGPRIELAKQLNIEMPERIKPDLLIIRNSAVHSGRPISADQAWAAIRITREMVDKYEPLDANCDEVIQVYGGENSVCGRSRF